MKLEQCVATAKVSRATRECCSCLVLSGSLMLRVRELRFCLFSAPLPPFSCSFSRSRDPQFLTSLNIKTLFSDICISERGKVRTVTFEFSGFCPLSDERRFGRASKHVLLWWKDPRKVSSAAKITDSLRGKAPKQSENYSARSSRNVSKSAQSLSPPPLPPFTRAMTVSRQRETAKTQNTNTNTGDQPALLMSWSCSRSSSTRTTVDFLQAPSSRKWCNVNNNSSTSSTSSIGSIGSGDSDNHGNSPLIERLPAPAEPPPLLPPWAACWPSRVLTRRG